MIARLLRFLCWLRRRHGATKEELRSGGLSWHRCLTCGFMMHRYTEQDVLWFVEATSDRREP